LPGPRFKRYANQTVRTKLETWRAPNGIPSGALKFSVSPPVSRVLDGLRARARRRDGHSSWTPVARRLQQPTRTAGSGHDPEALSRFGAKSFAPSLFGLAPGGVCRAAGVAASAVRSYRTVSPLPRLNATRRGGLFSVALSLGSHPPDVIRHRLSMEPGLSSPATFRCAPERPSGRLTRTGMGAEASAVKGPRRQRARKRAPAPPYFAADCDVPAHRPAF
jgi:hypothetical protein